VNPPTATGDRLPQAMGSRPKHRGVYYTFLTKEKFEIVSGTCTALLSPLKGLGKLTTVSVAYILQIQPHPHPATIFPRY